MDISVSPETSALLDAAAAYSVRHGQRYVGVEHVYLVLSGKPHLFPKPFSEKHGASLQSVARGVERTAWRGVIPASGSDIFYTPRCAEAMNEAARLAERLSRTQPGAPHLLLALLADPHGLPSRVADMLGLRRDELLADLRAALSARREVAKTVAVSEEKPKDEKTSPPLSLVRDLTEAARDGRIEPAIGREHEVFELLQILTRKNKNNAILVGEAGVGKTKLVESLAVTAAEGGMSGLLEGWRILELDIGSLLSGTAYRGSLEEKLRGLLDELKGMKDTILFIDEIHLIMGAGTVEGGSVDVANLLKPALARGEIRCVGATTIQEYRKFIERDPALERRFQMVRVEALSEGATQLVLEKIRPSLEKHHGVKISDRALGAVIELTQRYLPNRQLPDKAIDVLDQACARYRLKAIVWQGKPASPERTTALERAKVTPHDVRKVVSAMAGVPVERLSSEDRKALGGLEAKLKERVIGQDEACARVAALVKRARVGLADANRPSAVMLFAGSSGVGKTEMAKELARQLFGSADKLVSFDMSEYVEPHSVSRLLGAPPGYVGSEEEGRLTGAVKTNPFSVVLFDEIEKAHPRVFDILLPVLEEGRLRDSRGREVNFKNCVIILTSNAGAHVLDRTAEGNGRTRLMEDLRKHFRPEFINRVDEIVPFYPLMFEDVRAILRIFVKDLRLRLRDKRIDVRMYQGAYELMAKAGYSAEFGARELRRTVERMVVEPIGEAVLSGRFNAGDLVGVLMEEDRLVFRREDLEERTVA
ncbi:MAG: ATP-dependent Clp protease ATP-binding subunit [FCB group bacterium]|nr:ATP-dependent Clp protease ATP-binding subunit [FCB group bacterium]